MSKKVVKKITKQAAKKEAAERAQLQLELSALYEQISGEATTFDFRKCYSAVSQTCVPTWLQHLLFWTAARERSPFLRGAVLARLDPGDDDADVVAGKQAITQIKAALASIQADTFFVEGGVDWWQCTLTDTPVATMRKIKTRWTRQLRDMEQKKAEKSTKEKLQDLLDALDAKTAVQVLQDYAAKKSGKKE
jgi:hypothetical protein